MATPSVSSLSNSGSARSCPQCGRPVPPGAALGLCPACLLAAGLPTQPHDPAPPPLAPADIAAEFPQLDILALLGRGGMGAVYKARQRDLDRIVALKILRPGLDADPTFADRFRHEARALAQLNHPGIVTLYETGRTSGGLYFILMEFVDGLTLRQLLDTRAGPLPAREALEIVPQICDALQYAHDRGVVHRDIKPENILLDRQGRVKVADFGLARIAGPRGAGVPPAMWHGHPARLAEKVARASSPCSAGVPPASFSPDSGLPTRPGKIMGTPAYMAPEQTAASGEVDHRADIYALGVVLYQMLTGELPPSARPLTPPSKKVHIDVRLDEIVLRALQQNPARRYAQASELKTQVETVTRTSSASTQAPASSEHTPPPFPALPRHPFVLPFLVSLAAMILYLGVLVWAADVLPPRVASHFNYAGRADAWMPRSTLLLVMEFSGLGVAFITGVLFLAIHHVSLRFINLPFITPSNRRYWMSPERLPATLAFAQVRGLWFIPGLLGFFSLLVILVVHANRLSPPRLPLAWLAATILFLLGVMFVSFTLPFITHKARGLPLSKPHRPFPPVLAFVLIMTGLLLPSLALLPLTREKPARSKSPPPSASSNARTSVPASAPTSTDPGRLRFLREASPVTFAGISAELRQAASGLVPDSAIQVSDEQFQITSDTVRLTLVRTTRPVNETSALPQVTRDEHSFTFINSGFDSAAGEGVRVELVCTASPPASDPLLEALMQTSLAWLHAGQETLVDRRGESLRVNTEVFLDGNALDSVEIRPSPSPEHGKHQILFRLTTEGVFRLDQLFQSTRKRRIAIVLDQRVLGSPTVMAESAPSAVSLIADLSDEEAALLTGLPRATSSSGRQNPPERQAVSTAVERARVWLQLIDAGPEHYAQSWRDASAGFRTAVGETEWVSTLKAVRPSLGSVVSRRLISSQETHTLPGAPDGHYVVMRFSTDFSRQKAAIETVTFTEESDGVWRVTGYYIH
ncbi:serine/threonine protein kinase [Opitutaceae bacterium TAV1]|nr:serine/threonine protein kinase [Opitutaceae bacterium TAV1]